MLDIIRPSFTLRPHHARMQEIQQILRGKADPEFHGRLRIAFMADMSNELDAGYRFDVIRSLDTNDLIEYGKGIEIVDMRLQSLTNDSFIHLDLAPDPYCYTGCRMRHCVSTNYKTHLPSVDVAKAEKYHIDILRRDLEAAGYKYGADFIEKQTTHTLYDLKGNQLDHPEEGSLRRVKFNSLVVRTEALRDSRISCEPPARR